MIKKPRKKYKYLYERQLKINKKAKDLLLTCRLEKQNLEKSLRSEKATSNYWKDQAEYYKKRISGEEPLVLANYEVNT